MDPKRFGVWFVILISIIVLAMMVVVLGFVWYAFTHLPTVSMGLPVTFLA